MLAKLGIVVLAAQIITLNAYAGDYFGDSGQESERMAFSSCRHNGTTFKCVEFVSNIDGDTLRVNIPGVHPLLGDNAAIRVRGINTPEIGRAKTECEKEAGIRAKLEVKRFMQDAELIELRNYKRGSFFRIVADVIVDGKSLAQHLLNNKYAVVYKKKTKKDKEDPIDWCNFY